LFATHLERNANMKAGTSEKKHRTFVFSLVLAVLVVGICGWPSDGRAGPATTTGYTFNLPAGFSMHNVYVLTVDSIQGADGSGTDFPTDYLLLAGSAGDAVSVTPAGFTVPTGASSFDLVTLLGTGPQVGWAVAGLFTDASSVDHVIVGTSGNLAGQPVPVDCVVGCVYSDIVSWLKTGQLALPGDLGVGFALGDGIIGPPNLMTPFGNTGELWEFSTGTQVNGASVTANNFGVPNGPAGQVPEPSTWLLVVSGMAGLAAWRRKKAARLNV
jgi:hypothetical protein